MALKPRADPNPYAPPVAGGVRDWVADETRPFAAGLENILAFRRQSVLILLGLLLFTFGLYAIYWYYRQVRTLNRMLPENSVSLGWVFGALILLLVNWLVLFAAAGGPGPLENLASLLNWNQNAINLILAFKVRNRLNEALGCAAHGPDWFSGLGTFFFQLLYLQWKINDIDASRMLGERLFRQP